MSKIFPVPIVDLPEADVPIEGIKAYLSQGFNHQVLFMEYVDVTYFNQHDRYKEQSK